MWEERRERIREELSGREGSVREERERRKRTEASSLKLVLVVAS